MRILLPIATAALLVLAPLHAQSQTYQPITEQMMENPPAEDWLMYSRTYDAQRFSPLDQITKDNVGNLRLAWARQHGTGAQESIPLVHDGVMYVLAPGSAIEALDATNGNLIWRYQRDLPPNQRNGRSKTIAMFEDMVYWTSPDSFVVALDARTGELRWESQTDTRGATQGAVVAGDKVISGGTCSGNHDNCYISAHDARTGELLWKFFTAAGDDDPIGGPTWGNTPEDMRYAATWGLGGSYDPETNLVIWSVANPTPNTRIERHGAYDNAPMQTPADLYSDSTIAINADTGELEWYYQYIPADDWDQDWTNERIMMTSAINPTAETAKWFNPDAAGETHDIAIAIGEPGGIFAIDRTNGEFLWANPWPYDVDNFVLERVDPDGTVHINQDLLFTGPNQQKIICFFNTKSYWPAAYNPNDNSIYAPYTDTCLDMRTQDEGVRPVRNGTMHPGIDPNEFAGVSRINVETGKIEQIYKDPVPINSAMLVTAGELVFFGDLDRNLKAIDTQSGEVVWEQIVGGSVSNSMITYSVEGKQYVAVLTGDGLLTPSVVGYVPGLQPPRGANGIYVFALPDDE